MLSKDHFITTINELHEIENDIDNAHTALQKLDPDFGGLYLSRVTSLVVQTLKRSMDDIADWISYFIYELDYGKKWKSGMVVSGKGKDIKLKTAEDLYVCIKIGWRDENSTRDSR